MQRLPLDTLVLMACSERKIATERPVPLLELYDGPMWRTLRANLGAVPAAAVVVLSGGLGLLEAGAYAMPYNARLTAPAAAMLVDGGLDAYPGANVGRCQEFRPSGPTPRQVLERAAGPWRQVIVAAPAAYRAPLLELVGKAKRAGLIAADAVVVAEGGGILEQCAALKRALAAVQPAEAPIAPAAEPELVRGEGGGLPALARRVAVNWERARGPLDRKRERAQGRTASKAAPLLAFDVNQPTLF
jgi:hypothetical protein